MNHGYHNVLFKKIHVTDAVLPAESFPPVFKVPDVMTMPHDAQRISFIEPDRDLNGTYPVCIYFATHSLYFLRSMASITFLKPVAQ